MNSNGVIHDVFYEKGAFIVPFTGNLQKDTLATVVLYDYNVSCEIENDGLKVEVFELLNPIETKAYRLVEPRIAQHLGRPTRYGWPCYLQIAEAGGFLTMEFLLDNETIYLNGNDFNVFMWPYRPDPGTVFEMARSLSYRDNFDAVRKFVREGGGYIGSCYGAVAASSGLVWPIFLFSLRPAYNPELSVSPPYFTFSISDSLMEQRYSVLKNLFISTVEIQDIGHPLSFGLNKTVKEFFGGPWFFWLGRNTHEVAVIKRLENEENTSSGVFNKIVGSPEWVYSKFGEGKVVLFSGHPEFVINISILFERFDWEGDKYYGRRVVHNSLFYVTSEDLGTWHVETCYPLSQIEYYRAKTKELPFNSCKGSMFANVKKRLCMLNDNLSHLKNISSELKGMFSDIFNGTIFETESRLFLYVFHFCDIFSDFNNKTLVTLDKLEHVFPLKFNDLQLVEGLLSEISWRLNRSTQLVSEVIVIAERIKIDLMQRKPSILRESRKMLRTFEVGLKYIPQTFFESLKLLRHIWYHHEVDSALG
jgi:hypothetical protein